MSEATCKTCPNWSDEDCRADVLKQYTPADHWCGKHPVRVAAYEAEVQKERGRLLRDMVSCKPLPPDRMEYPGDASGVPWLEVPGSDEYATRLAAECERSMPKMPDNFPAQPKPQYEHDLEREARERTADVAGVHPATMGVKEGTLVVPRGSPPGTPPLEVVRIVGDFIRWKATDPAASGEGGICRWSALELAR